MVLPFQKVKELCPLFARNIAQDIRQLNECYFGKKFSASTQSFQKVPRLPIFVFEHSTHMACCSVTYTALLKGIRQFDNNPRNILCDVKDDMVHHLLQPFFGNNDQVRMIYKSLLEDDTTTAEEKTFFQSIIDKLDEKVDRNKGADLCFETVGQGDAVATMMSENSWTKRLVGCLRKILPRLKDHIQYTGTIAFPHIQSKTSTLPCFLCGCYPFQGAPDITVHSIAICNDLGRSDEGKGGNACSDESGGSEIVEHGLDKLQKEQHHPKLGQLVTGMHMVLIGKVLKKFLCKHQ